MGWIVEFVRGAALLASAVTLMGCFTSGDGREPQGDRLYFPTGLVVSPGGHTLYVANSDFDLQFSGGSVQALDLAAIRRDTRVIVDTIAQAAAAGAANPASEACSAAGRTINTNPWLEPGPCAPFVLAPYVKRFAFIGAFASGLLLAHDPDGGNARLFVPVRGDPSITYFDVDDDRGADSTSFELECMVDSASFCNPQHRVGQDPDRNLRGVQLPPDPVGIASTNDGVAIVSAHQSQGAASLMINDWAARPELSYFAGNLPAGPTEVVAIPEPGFVAVAEQQAADAGRSFDYRRGFAVTFQAQNEVDLLRYHPDDGAVPPRPFITRASVHPITAAASGFDSRGLTIVDAERRTCEATCGSVVDELSCLVACAEEVPLRVYMANRQPASLFIGQMQSIVQRVTTGGEQVVSSATEDLFFYDSVPLSFGPSRVEVGKIINQAGETEDRVFAVAFDTRSIFMFNPTEHRIEAVIRTGRGPHDIAFDTGVDDNGEPFSFLHVGHFTDSYIGVVDLDRRRPLTYSQMFATVGVPVPPTESN